jgi:hypothetical protein
MSLPEVLSHCGGFCEVITRDRKLFGVLMHLSAAAFLIRPRIGADAPDAVVFATDIVSVTPMRYPHL